MVGVIMLNLQKKCILVAKKCCNNQWKISYALLLWTSWWWSKSSIARFWPSSRSEKKELIAEKKMFLSEKKLRICTFPFQRNASLATKKIYFQHIENLYVNMAHLYAMLKKIRAIKSKIFWKFFVKLYKLWMKKRVSKNALALDFQYMDNMKYLPSLL